MFKNENGFSLVELAIAAGLAVALAATAVTILSGTTANLSSKANGAAGTSTTYNSNVLANASGAVSGGSNNGGNNVATFGTASAIISAANATLWDGAPDVPSDTKHFLTVVDNGGYGFGSTIGGAAGLSFNSLAEIESVIASGTGNGPYAAFVYDLSGAAQGHIVANYMGIAQHIYNVDVNGNVIAF